MDFRSASGLIDELKVVWKNEAAAPELLPIKQELVNDIRTILIQRENEIPRQEEEDHFVHFWAVLLQQEVQRVKFMLRAYLRARLIKIEKYAMFLLSDAEALTTMSVEETEYARKYVDLMEKHFTGCFLGSLPERLQQLDLEDTKSGPNRDSFVFLKCVQSVGGVDLGEAIVDMDEGDIYVMRYAVIADLVKDGRVQLI